MTEEIKNETNELAQPDEKAVFTIYISKNGEMRIEGALLGDLIASLGILEKAKFMVNEMHKPQIIKSGVNNIMNFVRNGKR